jgi:hypothetical protein
LYRTTDGTTNHHAGALGEHEQLGALNEMADREIEDVCVRHEQKKQLEVAGGARRQRRDAWAEGAERTIWGR